MVFMFAAGKMKINIKNGSTAIATLDYTTPGTYVDTRDVPAGATISYELLVVMNNGSTVAPARWMPPNVAPHSATCGTACSNQSGGYFALVPLANVMPKVTEGGYEFVDLSQTYTLFKMAERTKNTVDTAVVCINDQKSGPQGGTADDDFNDMVMLWGYKAGTPTTPPPTTTVPPPTTTVPPPTTTVPPTQTQTVTVTHTPSDTGFAEDILLYLGGILYAVGVIAFMGARVLGTKSGIRR
jgi:hypothetical protein